jgi:hypothetical protein
MKNQRSQPKSIRSRKKARRTVPLTIAGPLPDRWPPAQTIREMINPKPARKGKDKKISILELELQDPIGETGSRTKIDTTNRR